MTPTTATKASKPDKTTITLMGYEFTGPGPVLTMRTCPFPAQWLRVLRQQWYAISGNAKKRLPTYSLLELISSLDPEILLVSRDLEDTQWMFAHRDVDAEVIRIAVAAWASTAITYKQPDLNWEALLAPVSLEWRTDDIPLGKHDAHSNETGRLPGSTYQLLPNHLAGLVVDNGLIIQDEQRSFILGPLEADGERSAISWPPEKMPDNATGDALWSYQVKFHIETVPTEPEPRILADLGVVRYAYQPVSYTPSKAGKKNATIWIQATQGFLRSRERPTVLTARAVPRKVDGKWRWQWNDALAHALARLTTRTFPDPNDTIEDPASHIATLPNSSAVPDIQSVVLYRTGMKMRRPQHITRDKAGNDLTNWKHFIHAVGTGFLPVDHINVHEALTPLLAQADLSPVGELARDDTFASNRLPRVQPQDQHYNLELWTEPGETADGILTAITHPKGLGLTAVDSNEPHTRTFAGDYTLHVTSHTIGQLSAGIKAPPATDDDPQSGKVIAEAVEKRIGEIATGLPHRPDRCAAIFQVGKPDFFSRAGTIDPYRALKTGFVKASRLPQGIFSISTQPPSTDPKDIAKLADGTAFTTGDIKRATASILDALRQAGRGAVLPPQKGLDTPSEVTGIWLESHQGRMIPIAMRVDQIGEITAELYKTGRIAYPDLPAALIDGAGRLPAGYRESNSKLSEFLTGIIDPDATHDRLVLVRAANTRKNERWAWLQDQHIRPNHLHLPGIDPATTTLEPQTPADLPGLRLMRIRERGTQGEVARAFISYIAETENEDTGELTLERKYARATGVYPINRSVYYGVAPRPAQAQTPTNLTKLDPDRPGNARAAGWNPNPIEIVAAFVQEHDDPAAWAAYTQLLRRAHLHTVNGTKFPMPMHQASLADEYLK